MHGSSLLTSIETVLVTENGDTGVGSSIAAVTGTVLDGNVAAGGSAGSNNRPISSSLGLVMQLAIGFERPARLSVANVRLLIATSTPGKTGVANTRNTLSSKKDSRGFVMSPKKFVGLTRR